MSANIVRIAVCACALIAPAALVSHAAPVDAGAAPSSQANAALGDAMRFRPGIRGAARRLGGASSATYTLADYGTPSTVNSAPIGFNNTGQIFGEAGSSGSVVWTGKAYVTLPLAQFAAGADINECGTTDMNDADKVSGDYEIVGTCRSKYSTPSAFAAIASPSGFVKSTIFYAYENSSMLGVNGAGVSLASADSYPVDTRDLSGSQYYTTANATDYLTLLQSPASGQVPIHYLLPLQATNTACPFGGCYINDLGQVLGYDFFSVNVTANTSAAAVYTPGNPSSIVDVPIELLGSYGEPYDVMALNNSGQLLYNSNPKPYNQPIPELYDISSGKKTRIPVATASCPSASYGHPISLNNEGAVLGSYICGSSLRYFTWDPVHGAQDLNSQIPPNKYSTVYPLGINDHGQILVALYVDGKSYYDWGTLDPIAAKSSRAVRGLRVRSQ
jgi:hypothetical protein